MAIIPLSVNSEMTRKSDDENYINTLLKLYSPKDLNKDKENLLTIYLKNNNKTSFFLLNLFIKNKFNFQENFFQQAIYYSKVNEVIETQINANKLEEVRLLFSYVKNDLEFILNVPTYQKKALFDMYYRKNQKKHLNIDDLKKYFSLYPFFYEEDQQKNYFSDTTYIFNTLLQDNILNKNEIENLTDPSILEILKRAMINGEVYNIRNNYLMSNLGKEKDALYEKRALHHLLNVKMNILDNKELKPTTVKKI